MSDDGTGSRSVFVSVNVGLISGVNDGRGSELVFVSVNLETEEVKLSLIAVFSPVGFGSDVVEVAEEVGSRTVAVLGERGLGGELVETVLKPLRVFIAVNCCPEVLEVVDTVVVPSLVADLGSSVVSVLDVDESAEV